MEISITKTTAPAEKPDSSILGFGKYFTDHMFIMDYSQDEGWHDARIVPFGRFPIHPASTVLHYGSEIFEGLKAYRKADGSIQMFRPLENIRRMNRSAVRMCLPEIPEDLALEVLTKFVSFEQDWVPSANGTSLYIRPFMFGNDESLGVHSVKNATFMIITSPVGSYYKEGINPVKIMIESEDVRAVRGGTGEAKCGGNYAASNRAGERAEQMGYSQVLWLDGVERKYILELLRKEGIPAVERLISIDELVDAMEKGTLEEAWGCGTAAVVSPIGELCYNGKKYAVNGGKIGELTQHLYDTLTGIQWGKVEDTFGWTYSL